MKLSPHFSTIESTCRCGCGFGSKPSDIDGNLINLLELIRKELGPTYINSFCRCPEHNAEIGGSDISAHMTGQAADIRAFSPQEKFKIVNTAIEAGYTRIEIGRAYVHVDVSRTLPQCIIGFNPA